MEALGTVAVRPVEAVEFAPLVSVVVVGWTDATRARRSRLRVCERRSERERGGGEREAEGLSLHGLEVFHNGMAHFNPSRAEEGEAQNVGCHARGAGSPQKSYGL